MEPYELIRSRRRTMALEITRDGRVLVRAPLRLPQTRIDAFVAAHGDWVAVHLKKRQQRLAETPPPTPEHLAALRAQAAAVLPGLVADWSRRMGVTPVSIRITAARKRYGSCSGKNGLCFSCFLMERPPEAVELVVVHELCHIREKNHGPGFYALLGQYLPDYQARKRLL